MMDPLRVRAKVDKPYPTDQVDSDKTMVTQVQAKWEYTSEDPDHLNFPAGAIIDITIQDANNSGWWEGSYEGKKGIFPINRTMVHEIEKNVYKSLRIRAPASRKILALQQKINKSTMDLKTNLKTNIHGSILPSEQFFTPPTAPPSASASESNKELEKVEADKKQPAETPSEAPSEVSVSRKKKRSKADREAVIDFGTGLALGDENPPKEESSEEESESDDSEGSDESGSDSDSEDSHSEEESESGSDDDKSGSDESGDDSEGEIEVTEEQLQKIRDERAKRRAQKATPVSDSDQPQESESEKEEQERIRLEKEAQLRKEEERIRLEEERVRKEEEDRLQKEKEQKENEERLRKEEEERIQKEKEEQLRGEEEERIRLEKEEQLRLEEEKLKEEAERLQKEKEEQIRQEEERIRKESEEQERIQKEQLRKEEEERIRLEKLKEEEARIRIQQEKEEQLKKEEERLRLEKENAEKSSIKENPEEDSSSSSSSDDEHDKKSKPVSPINFEKAPVPSPVKDDLVEYLENQAKEAEDEFIILTDDESESPSAPVSKPLKELKSTQDRPPTPVHIQSGESDEIQFSTDQLVSDSDLWTASEQGDLNLVTKLLEQGTDVNKLNQHGSTALHCAAKANQHAVILYLLAHGAQGSILDANQRMAHLVHGCRKDTMRVVLRNLGTAPVWIPDGASPTCLGCQATFTFWNRRHHCRNCGILACGSCTSKVIPIPKLYPGGKTHRVCTNCYDALSQP